MLAEPQFRKASVLESKILCLCLLAVVQSALSFTLTPSPYRPCHAGRPFFSSYIDLKDSSCLLPAIGRLRGGEGSGSITCSAQSAVVEIPPTEELQAVLKVAKTAAEDAASLMKRNIGASVQKSKISSKDLLTEIDPMCQKVIESHVAKNFPGHQFLGEESVPPGAEESAKALERLLESEWLWIVDPIDGTTNFVQGMPMSAVSIGVAYKGQPVVGVIADPYREEVFEACKGGGVFLNGQIISCGNEVDISEAVIAAGSPTTLTSISPSLRGVKTENSIFSRLQYLHLRTSDLSIYFLAKPASRQIVLMYFLSSCHDGEQSDLEPISLALTTIQSLCPQVNALMPQCRTIRMLGSAAIHYAWIACGRLTAYFEPDLNSWDSAAGVVLIKEAGGRLSDLDGSNFKVTTRAVLASNGKTHDQILKVLQDARVTGMDHPDSVKGKITFPDVAVQED